VANTRGEKVAQIKETNTCDEYKKFNCNTIQLTWAINGEKKEVTSGQKLKLEN
jgi:hypothetical protein